MPAPSAVISVPTCSDAQHLVEARALDIEDLAAQRQHGLVLAVAALLGRAAGRVALDDEEFGLGRVLLLAVGELAGQRGDVERGLAAHQVARLARRFAGGGGLDDLAASPCAAGVGFSSNHAASASVIRLSTMGRTSDETSLSLVCDENFGSGTFTESTQVRPSRASSPEMSTFSFLASAALGGVLVDHARQRAAEAGQVRAAVALRDVVGEAEDVLVIAVVPLQRGLDDRRRPSRRDVDRLGDQRVALLVDVLDEGFDAALVLHHALPTARGRAGP